MLGQKDISDWETYTLNECLEALIDYRGKTPPKTTKGVPVISAKVVKNGHILDNIQQQIPYDFYDAWMTRGLPEVGDVVFTTEGPLGEVAQLDEQTRHYAIGQRIVVLRGMKQILNNTFLKFLLQSPHQQQIINSYATGTTVVGISQKDLREIPITIPPLAEQMAIAHVLGSLDDKIELNRQTNQTLEEMARALFKEWFIDFGPVRAKMRGEQPAGLSAELASLFPDRLDSEGKPEGWEWHRLHELTSYLNRGLSPSYVEDGGVLVLNQKCVRNNVVDISKARRHDPNKRKINGRELIKGDILVNSTGVGTLGRVAQLFDLSEPMIVDSHITVVRANSIVSSNFLGLNLIERQREIESLGEGSTGQTELNRKKLGDLSLLVPNNPNLFTEFDKLTVQLRERMSLNERESRTLAQMRDLLLPKLLSGQIRVQEAEHMVGALV